MNTKVNISPVNMQERADLGIRSGDTIRVWQKIEEKGKTRLQAFEGVVLARKHGNEAGGTFTVRKVASGVGVEKVFPLYSPMIDKIEIVKRTKVRRSKLYFLRDKVAREMKRVLRRTQMVTIATKGAAELEAERKVAEAKQKEIDDAQAKLEEEEKKAKEQAEEVKKEEETEGDSGETKNEMVEKTEEEKTADDKKEDESKEK